MRRLFAHCILPLLAAAQVDPNALISKEGITIRGRAVDASTGEPLAGIHLSISTLNLANVASATAGPDGRFSFTGLPDEPHFLTALLRGETVPYNSRAAFDANGEYWSMGDSEGKEIIFRIAPNPTVMGTVRDEFGDPIPNAKIEFLRPAWDSARLFFSPNNSAMTDDRGRYRATVSAGAYIVCAKMDRDLASRLAPLPGPVDLSSAQSARYYQRTCSSETPSASFKVSRGETREANLTLVPGTGVSLRGQISGVAKGSGRTVQLTRDDSLADDPVFDGSGDTFQFHGLKPGTYHLQAYSNGPSVNKRAAHQTIQVGDADVSGLALQLEDAPSIDVSIRGPANSVVNPSSVQISLRPIEPGLSYVSAYSSPGESYRLQGVDPGNYWLVTRTSDGLCIESAKFQGQDVLQRSFKVPPALAANLEVTVSNICSKIQGVVLDNGQGLPFAYVAVLLSGSPESPGDVFMMNADKDGKFTVVGLSPGRYFVWGWTREDPAFPGPPGLASAESQGAIAVVERGQTAGIAVLAVPPTRHAP